MRFRCWKRNSLSRLRQNLSHLDYRSDFLTTERMCVNYLRHCETRYEQELASIAGKAGARDAYYDIKELVLFAIADQYDWLEEECDRQIKEMRRKRDLSELWP